MGEIEKCLLKDHIKALIELSQLAYQENIRDLVEYSFLLDKEIDKICEILEIDIDTCIED